MEEKTFLFLFFKKKIQITSGDIGVFDNEFWDISGVIDNKIGLGDRVIGEVGEI